MTYRLRAGQYFMPEAPLYPLEQERSLELPLGYAPSPALPRVAVLLHAFHIGLLPEFRAYLDHIPGPADLFISTDTAEKRAAVDACFAGWAKGAVDIRLMPNRGRDIAAKIVGFAAVHGQYEYILHLHTKSSPHSSRLIGWRGYLLDTLLGSPEVVRGVFEVFSRAPTVGMLAPQHIDELRPWIRWGDNYANAERLAARMGIALAATTPLDFPSGSMFWARTAALRPLIDAGLGYDDFEAESGQIDGTLAHAIERLYFLVCEQAGFDWVKITAPGELSEQKGVAAATSPSELDRFLAHHRLRLSAGTGPERPVAHQPVILSPPPRPRRVLHVTWRAALEPTMPDTAPQHLVVVLHGEADASATLRRSVEVALRALPAGVHGQVLALPGGTRPAALALGFDAGATLVLPLGVPGLLHPQAAAALLRMSAAHGGRAAIALAGLPGAAAPAVNSQDFSAPSLPGPAVAVSRAVYQAGAPAGTGDGDIAEQARASGVPLVLCPAALFYPAWGADDPAGSHAA